MTTGHAGQLTDVIDTALASAVRAPSPHNTQPWRFEVRAGRIDVLLDRSRILRAADPEGREARLACGAALFNLRVALQAAGQATAVDLRPIGKPDQLATVWLTGACVPTTEDHMLAAAVDQRHTNRRVFTERPVSDEIRGALARAAALEGARLLVVDDPARLDAVVALLAEAEDRQRRDAEFCVELSYWATSFAGRDEGVPVALGGPRPRADGLADAGPFKLDAVALRPLPLVGVLVSPSDISQDVVRAGQALQRVLLTGTSSGVSASFLSPLVEVAWARRALRAQATRIGQPQAVLRFGYGQETAPTPRRPVRAVCRYTGA
ncbi:MAG: nitroreductase [Actinophytocola sp.]|uniref:Acg family FMN-binding oxidoreductase n=1 Tax=Actinophytocola sp. TaxID=1872138 RepID=UPI0013225B2E|nr:nitroreductase [Actinophytocola sp.]MPZ79023.1 nitroreductase [Actinophytocola sp.]